MIHLDVENSAVRYKEKSLLWKPYARESEAANKSNRSSDVWSGYTPVGGRRETIQKSKALHLPSPADALKHTVEGQINWRNIELESSSVLQDSEAKYQCSRCQRTYTSDSALVKHQRYYCNFYQTKSFTCKYCDKVYLSLGALKMHIRTHTLPCTCPICGKAFSRPWLLQGHVRTHTGEKPYECTSCNRAFADRSNLRAHLQTHSQIKKYKCERCAKTFSRMSLLTKHQTNCTCAM